MSDKAEPRVSVIMANYNGAAHIAAAVRSVLRQSETSLELLLCDDGSTDDSVARAQAVADGDARLVLLRSETRGGPAAARNRGLRAARGRWIAVVDNDDAIHPERLRRLLDAAERDGADIAADDLITFYEDGAREPHAHLRGLEQPRWVSAAAYETGNRSLGYLKPVFKRERMLTYDETLRIGEDSDLVLRMLMSGARLRVYPIPGYFYRKHAGSISHRLDAASIDALLAVYTKRDAGSDMALNVAFAEQRAALQDARVFTDFVAAVKRRDWGGAFGAAVKRPGALLLLRDAIAARLAPPKRREALPGPRITLLSRQRIVGATNGSSAYVLAIAGALRDAGYAVDYVGASPKIFGRWAVLRLKPETAVFDRYLVHGGLRVGSLVLARDPRVWRASALAVLEAGLRKLKLSLRLSRAADYAQGAPATKADMLYVARHADPAAKAVFCDYAYLTPLAPYALAQGAPTFVIMHDLISGRVADRAAEAATEKVAELSAAEEFALLGQADTVLAIQAEEGAKVRAALPRTAVVLAPHGVPVASGAQPGQHDALLFIGSNTAPNIVGLHWFFREVWPLVRAERPNATLKVAGSVARGLGVAPEGVGLLGVVDDLAPLYAEAGVVISPLYTGSGLKIKLVEALAAGKAVVGTSVTAQGVEAIVAGAMAREDEPAAFARAIITLAGDHGERTRLANAALRCAAQNFSTQAAFRDLIAHLHSNGAAVPQKPLPATAAASQ